MPVGRCALVPTGSSSASVASIARDTAGVVVPTPIRFALESITNVLESKFRSAAFVSRSKEVVASTSSVSEMSEKSITSSAIATVPLAFIVMSPETATGLKLMPSATKIKPLVFVPRVMSSPETVRSPLTVTSPVVPLSVIVKSVLVPSRNWIVPESATSKFHVVAVVVMSPPLTARSPETVSVPLTVVASPGASPSVVSPSTVNVEAVVVESVTEPTEVMEFTNKSPSASTRNLTESFTEAEKRLLSATALAGLITKDASDAFESETPVAQLENVCANVGADLATS